MSTKKDEKKAAKADKNEKNSKFALKLSELRRERGISQKKAATDLGISQALLSHYEKGIRECGLDFVIRCSEYYSVTTDYLLGVSESRNGFDVDAMNQQEEENGEFSVFTLGKATKYLLDLAATGSDEGALKYVSDYYTLCVYRGAITLAKAGLLPKEMFRLDYTLAGSLLRLHFRLRTQNLYSLKINREQARTSARKRRSTALLKRQRILFTIHSF